MGPVLSVLNGCGPIVQEHHNVSAETAARSFRVVCEGGVRYVCLCIGGVSSWLSGCRYVAWYDLLRADDTVLF